MVAVVLISMSVVGCTTTPMTVTPPAVPAGCGICKHVDAQGLIYFSRCNLPVEVEPGPNSCGRCCFRQSTPVPRPLRSTIGVPAADDSAVAVAHEWYEERYGSTPDVMHRLTPIT